MTWDKYDPYVRDQLKNNPVFRNTIIDMKNKGATKEECIRITGADYEFVDNIFNMDKKRRHKSDIDPDGNDQ